MRILGMPIPFTGESQKALSSVPYGTSGWYPVIHEPFPGAWQRNLPINTDTAASFHADFACKTLIARDIAKLRLKLSEMDENNIWSEVTNPAYSPVLRKPNDYQTRNQFWENWMLSKLSRGNTYVLKVRDNRNVVTALHVLDPTRVQTLVSDDGSVFYRISRDNLAGTDEITVPAREVIHDRMNCLFHPLCGTPPVFASGLASMLGLNAQKASALLFENSSMPGGIVTAPAEVNESQAASFKQKWEANFSKINLGRIAILDNGMKYEKIAMTNVEGQMVESLKWSAEVVCSVYHVPPYKVGVGALPSYNNVQALNVEYYSQALQSHIEEAEELLDHALGIGWGVGLGTEFDTENLLRMDSQSQVIAIRDAVGAGVMSPNEGRGKLDLKPVEGGESPYLQQQNYSLAALAKRDAQADPFAPNVPAPAASPAAANDDEESEEAEADEADVVDEKSIMVPPDLALKVASVVRLLHEAPPIVQRAAAPAPLPRVIRIERDDDGSLVPVYAEQRP
jgi:HK97 family phage portal protein